MFADRAQQHPGERPLPTAADDKEVSVTGGIEKHLRCDAVNDLGVNGYASVAVLVRCRRLDELLAGVRKGIGRKWELGRSQVARDAPGTTRQ